MRIPMHVLSYLVLSLQLLPVIIQAGDYRPSKDKTQPAQRPAQLQPEVQIDGFSCGLHAISAIYKSYGLNPSAKKLAARLGTTVKANPFDSTSQGTLHPDILRVLHQDAFQTIIIDKEKPDALDAVYKQLETDHFILALIQTRPKNGMHWVVITEAQNDQLIIADSLVPAPYWKPAADWLKTESLSLIAITPSDGKTKIGTWRSNFSGLREMTKAAKRLKK